MFNQFRDRPRAIFDASRLRGCHSDCAMRFAEVVIREIESDRSLKIFKLLLKAFVSPCQAAAGHPQCEILFFNVKLANAIHVRHSRDRPFQF
jgi:hypothetical protein